MIVVLAMIASAVIAASYLLSPGRYFHWANALLWPFLAISNAVVGWWPQSAMSATLGVGGVIALIRGRRREKPCVITLDDVPEWYRETFEAHLDLMSRRPYFEQIREGQTEFKIHGGDS